MAKLPVTKIYIARRSSIPTWFDAYLTTHLKIHRPSWEIKDTKGTPFGVHINAIMATKEWMEDINMYFKVWCDWAKKNPGVVKKAPPEVALPPERPPHRRSRPATKGSLPVIDL